MLAPIGVALAILGFAGQARLALASVEEVCGADPGWSIIAEASNDKAASTGFLCNYRVDRTKVTL